MLGQISRPEHFPYADVLQKGRPLHRGDDPFLFRHPAMPPGKRAKLFAPFDALRGFSAAVIARDVRYGPPRELSEEALAELDRRLALLRRLTVTAPVPVSVTFLEPCTDPESEFCRSGGRYRTVDGTCLRVDPARETLLLADGTAISLRSVAALEGDAFSSGGWDA